MAGHILTLYLKLRHVAPHYPSKYLLFSNTHSRESIPQTTEKTFYGCFVHLSRHNLWDKTSTNFRLDSGEYQDWAGFSVKQYKNEEACPD